jgi:hypothetical protein
MDCAFGAFSLREKISSLYGWPSGHPILPILPILLNFYSVNSIWDQYAREISWVVPIPTSFDPRKLDLIHLSPDA